MNQKNQVQTIIGWLSVCVALSGVLGVAWFAFRDRVPSGENYARMSSKAPAPSITLCFLEPSGRHINGVVIQNAVKGDPAFGASKSTGEKSNKMTIPADWTEFVVKAPKGIGHKSKVYNLSDLSRNGDQFFLELGIAGLSSSTNESGEKN